MAQMYNGKNIAVVFLCKEPKIGTIDFADKLIQSGFKNTYIVSDEKTNREIEFETNKEKTKATVIRVNDAFCAKQGYAGTNKSDSGVVLNKDVIAMDKFLYAFCEIKTEFDFIWVFEDDVFIPNEKVLLDLTENAVEYDLICANNTLRGNNQMDWHWRSIPDYVSKPHYCSMVCAMGISRRLLNEVRLFSQKHKHLIFSEILFSTLANASKFKIVCPFEFKTIVWLADWHLEIIYQLENNLFHPMKDIDKHKEVRSKIAKWKKIGKKPKKAIPKYLKALM